jgi:hypothetical protein
MKIRWIFAVVRYFCQTWSYSLNFKGRPQIASILKQGIQVNILISYMKQIRKEENINIKQIRNKQEYICL